jgi:hypothetical protein
MHPLNGDHADLAQRDQVILRAHLGSPTFREIGGSVGLSAERVRLAYDRAARAHLLDVLTRVQDAQATGDVYVLAVPAVNTDEMMLVIAYTVWFRRELAKQFPDIKLELVYVPAPTGGLAIAFKTQEVAP